MSSRPQGHWEKANAILTNLRNNFFLYEIEDTIHSFILWEKERFINLLSPYYMPITLVAGDLQLKKPLSQEGTFFNIYKHSNGKTDDAFIISLNYRLFTCHSLYIIKDLQMFHRS